MIFYFKDQVTENNKLANSNRAVLHNNQTKVLNSDYPFILTLACLWRLIEGAF